MTPPHLTESRWVPPPPFLLLLLSSLRYYFPGWHNKGSPLYAHRYGLAKGMEIPVMDDCVMTYLFFQVGLRDSHPWHRTLAPIPKDNSDFQLTQLYLFIFFIRS